MSFGPLVVITTYFNPCRYVTRRANYDLFIAGLRANNVPCITVECAFPGQDFELPESLDVIRVRANSLLWQKERLLNLAASWLPSSCEFVAWLDCDILFDDPSWGKNLIGVLDKFPVAQVFERCIRLSRDGVLEAEPPASSMGAVLSKRIDLLEGGRYDLHGHSGYGWAMRREIFDNVGLYEHAISGSADHFMAHAIFNNFGFCIENALKHDPVQISHLKEWGRRFYAYTQGKLGVLPGQIRHLWHGDTVNRRYFLRMHDITDLGYNPYSDILAIPGQPLEWSPGMNKPGLREYFSNYFLMRQEDGPAN